MEEKKLQSLAGKCIVRLKNGGSYYDGNAGYISDFLRAKIYNENEIPEYIKRNQSEEIIHLDSKEGLELLVKEFKDNQHYISIYKSRVIDAERTLNKLRGFDSVQKYLEEQNAWFDSIIGISHETEKKIIEEIVSEKANSN